MCEINDVSHSALRSLSWRPLSGRRPIFTPWAANRGSSDPCAETLDQRTVHVTIRVGHGVGELWHS